MKKKTIFNILNNKQFKQFNESIDVKKYKELTNSVKITEDDNQLYIEGMPLAFGNVENKHKRVYDQETLKMGVEFYNTAKKENPYFVYMFDGHSDEDTYKGIVGKVVKMYLNEDVKGVFIDMKLNKGSHIFPLLKNIIDEGDPIGVSMRILAPNSYKINKSELKEINDDIVWLEDESESVAKMFGGDEIEYVTGDGYIWRVDITQFPSFNNSYAQKKVLKDESVNIRDFIKSSCQMKEKYVCLTDSCKYRYTMRDFVDIINKDESILTIKKHPDMYDDIMKFAYFNMTDFNFNKIDDRKYLQKHLQSDNSVDREFVNSAISHIDSTARDIFDYIEKNKQSLTVKDVVTNLQNTLIEMTKDENIFYQIIVVNYVHQLLLSKLLYDKDDGLQVNGFPEFTQKIKLGDEYDKYNEYLSSLIETLKNGNMDIYDLLNAIFSFIYNIVDNFGEKLPPNVLLSESISSFNIKNNKKRKLIFKGKFIVAKRKCKKKKKK